VLALTASPGSQESHIKEVCASLGIKNIEIKALEDQDVAPYSHDINVEWRTVELPEEFKTMKGSQSTSCKGRPIYCANSA